MTAPDPIDLDHLDALYAAATPAPWETASIGPDHKIIAIVQREDGDWVPVAYFCDWQGEGGSAEPENDRQAIVALRNLAPALLRLWRAASREANTPTIRRLRDYEIDAALHELEAHRP